MVPMGGYGLSRPRPSRYASTYMIPFETREPPQINMLGESCTAPEEKVANLKQDMASLKNRVKTLQQENVKLLKDLKEQRKLAFHWHYCCDRLLDLRLCRDCQEDKDDAFMMGKGFTWFPEYCGLIDCELAKMRLRKGLPGSPETFLMSDYWEEDPVLKSLENRWVTASLKVLVLEDEEEAKKE